MSRCTAEALVCNEFGEASHDPFATAPRRRFGCRPSGGRLRFVAPGLYRALIDARIGIETMDTAAACRTYNILVGEGRQVLLALIVEPN